MIPNSTMQMVEAEHVARLAGVKAKLEAIQKERDLWKQRESELTRAALNAGCTVECGGDFDGLDYRITPNVTELRRKVLAMPALLAAAKLAVLNFQRACDTKGLSTDDLNIWMALKAAIRQAEG